MITAYSFRISGFVITLQAKAERRLFIVITNAYCALVLTGKREAMFG